MAACSTQLCGVHPGAGERNGCKQGGAHLPASSSGARVTLRLAQHVPTAGMGGQWHSLRVCVHVYVFVRVRVCVRARVRVCRGCELSCVDHSVVLVEKRASCGSKGGGPTCSS